MGSYIKRRFTKCHNNTKQNDQKFLKELFSVTHFNKVEFLQAITLYNKTAKAFDPVKNIISQDCMKGLLKDYFDYSNQDLALRIVKLLEPKSASYMTLSSWLKLISLFLRGSLDEKIEFCFKVYDVSESQSLNLHQIERLIYNTIIPASDPEDRRTLSKDIAAILIAKMDKDHDGRLSYEDYRQAVLTSPGLLECFGQCLPSATSSNTLHVMFNEGK